MKHLGQMQLTQERPPAPPSLINEVRAYREYCRVDVPLCYWRTSSGFEVNLIAGEMDLALEFKSTIDVRLSRRTVTVSS